jgi:hypothetical protein
MGIVTLLLELKELRNFESEKSFALKAFEGKVK